jgi:predicted Zn finger-like uncharacterized protein
MIITCPACTKRYLVEENAVGTSGRQVQCVSCAHQWLYTPEPILKADQVHLDLIGTQTIPSEKGMNLGWLLVFLTLFFLCLSGYLARQPIMQTWPSATVIYKTLGISVFQAEGLKFADLKPQIQTTPQGQNVVLTGSILNEGQSVSDLKKLTIIIKGTCTEASWFERLVNKFVRREGQDQCHVAKWTYQPSATKIYPGEHITFETASPQPIKGALSLQVHF